MFRPSKDINRAIEQIADRINKLEKSIKESYIDKSKSNNGIIRIVKNGDNEYQIELKHKDGWVVSNNSNSTGFKLKEN